MNIAGKALPNGAAAACASQSLRAAQRAASGRRSVVAFGLGMALQGPKATIDRGKKVRFSGRVAPRHPGGIPALPDEVTCEAYSHEVSSAGFWPGGGGVDFPAFYCYAYPAPDGFSDASIAPQSAYFDTTLGEFILLRRRAHGRGPGCRVDAVSPDDLRRGSALGPVGPRTAGMRNRRAPAPAPVPGYYPGQA
jgi:hypothetical protein